MAKITKAALVKSGVESVLEALDVSASPKIVNKWLTIPEVKEAAKKDAEKRYAYYKVHGDFYNCKIPHNNLFRVLCKYLGD